MVLPSPAAGPLSPPPDVSACAAQSLACGPPVSRRWPVVSPPRDVSACAAQSLACGRPVSLRWPVVSPPRDVSACAVLPVAAAPVDEHRDGDAEHRAAAQLRDPLHVSAV